MIKNLNFRLEKINSGNEFSLKRISPFLFLTFQLLMVNYIIKQLEIELEVGLHIIFPVILTGFVFNYWIPMRFRIPCFIICTLIAAWFFIGFKVLALVFVLLIYLLVSHLNISFNLRLFFLFIITAILICVRLQYIAVPNSIDMLTILGAMILFRMILYLYEIKHTKKPTSIWFSLSYFLMIPNVVLLYFPVVDYKKFTRFYYNVDEVEIYQKGIARILRGILLLIIYRSINFYFAVPSEDVADVYSLIQFVLVSYSIMLRLGGILWIALGVLQLFGFNLPKIIGGKRFDYIKLKSSSFNVYNRNVFPKEINRKYHKQSQVKTSLNQIAKKLKN